MQGDPEVIEFLNEALTAELTAINQYFIHAKMCENWGFARLAEKIREESIDEMKDADVLIERILYLDGVPNLQRYGNVTVERYNRGIELAVAKHDNGTRELLEARLVGEESHADWLETQIELVRQVGIEQYLATQIHE